MKIGSLFSGYGGLDLAVEAVTGATPAWFCEWDDAPSKVLAHHWPDVPNHRDVTAIDWDTVEPVDIITGGSPCFTAGTPVLTSRGYVPIEHVVVGDTVLTHNNRWKRVTHTMTREAETVEFQPGFYATPDHRFWTRPASKVWNNDIRQYRRKLGDPKWTPVAEAKGMFIAQPINVPPVVPVPEIPEGMTYWHLGRWVADGWIDRNNGAPVIALGKQKIERDRHRFGEEWRESHERTALKMHLRHGGWAEWFDKHFGHSASGKTIPAWLLSAPENDRREFLAGYWAGDAYTIKGKAKRSVSVSPCLTVGIRTLCESLNYTTSIHYNRVSPTKVIEGRTVNQRNWWSMTATPNDGRYTDTIGDHRWSKVRRQPNTGGVQNVYDLTVEDDHSFIAAGFVVHNCQDLSAAGKRAGMTEGTRSNLWVNMREAIATIRPRLVVWENVQGALSAPATSDSDMEPAAGLLGNPGGGHLRALGRVLGDLTEIGYDTEWTTLRASDIGAPHHRARVFLIARPRHAHPQRDDGRQGHASTVGGHRPSGQPRQVDLNTVVVHLPTPRASDANGACKHGAGGKDLRTAITELSHGASTPPLFDAGNAS